MRRTTACGSFLAVAALVAACSDPISPPTLLTVSPSTLTLALGESATLSGSVRNALGGAVITAVAWSSSQPSVASVSDGIVTAIRPGTAEITASGAGLSDLATVTVQDQKAPTVTITSPASGTKVNGDVTVAARINDDHTLARISLTVDGVEVDSDHPLGGPGFQVDLTWDSNAATDGEHTLTVQATDSTGNVGSASVDVVIVNPFVLSVSGTVTSAGFNAATQRHECTSVLTAAADRGAADTRAEWQSGQVQVRNLNGTVRGTLSLDAGDLLDYFGSSHISTGATQIANRLDWSNTEFDLFYTFRAGMPDGTVSSIGVSLDCY